MPSDVLEQITEISRHEKRTPVLNVGDCDNNNINGDAITIAAGVYYTINEEKNIPEDM